MLTKGENGTSWDLTLNSSRSFGRSKQCQLGLLPPSAFALVIHHRPAADRWRNGVLMFKHRFQPRLRSRSALLYTPNERIQTLEPIHLVGAAQFGGVQRATKHAQRIVVGLERNGKGMAVFSTEREREPGGIRKTAGCSMDHLG